MREEENKYGNLSEKELLDFLNDIEDEDNSLKEDTENKFDFSELQENETNSDIESRYNDKAWVGNVGDVMVRDEEEKRANAQKSADVRRRKRIELEAEKKRIQQASFNQEDIDLSGEINTTILGNLIAEVTLKYENKVKYYEDFINRRLTRLLMPLVPRQIKNIMASYPNIVKMSKGFFYRTSEQYGNLVFWATPEIPAFFEQNCERETILEQHPQFIENLDHSVSLYFKAKEELMTAKIKNAGILVRSSPRTYFDLLKLNPLWFAIVYRQLTGKEI